MVRAPPVSAPSPQASLPSRLVTTVPIVSTGVLVASGSGDPAETTLGSDSCSRGCPTRGGTSPGLPDVVGANGSYGLVSGSGDGSCAPSRGLSLLPLLPAVVPEL